MQGMPRYAVAITGTGKASTEDAIAHLFSVETAAALNDGRRGDVALANLPLLNATGVLADMGDKAQELVARSEEYLSVTAPWFGFAAGVQVLEQEISALEATWNGFPIGSVALRMRTDRGDVVFIRDDVTFGQKSGHVFHQRSPKRPITLLAISIDEGSPGDAALTISEYAAFMIPGVGPIVAGVINVLHSWAKRPRHAMPNEQVVAEIGEMMKRLIVAEDQAAVMGDYLNYMSAMANASDDDPQSINDYAAVADSTLDMEGALIKAYHSLTFNAALANVGVRSWCFTASYLLLALRHGITLDANTKSKSIHQSQYWRRLRLAYHEVLSHLGDVMQNENKDLRNRLAQISGVTEFTHERTDCVELPSGPGPCKTETVLDGYGFTDVIDKKTKRVAMRAPAKHKSRDDLINAITADRNAYVEKTRKEFLANFYKEGDVTVAQIQTTNAELLHTWHESFENTIMAAVKGWKPGQDYPLLKSWPEGPNKQDPEGKDKLVVRCTEGSRCESWSGFLDPNAGEIVSGYLKSNNPVFRNIGENKGKLELSVPHEAKKIYALRICVVVGEYMRSFRVRWDGAPLREDASQRVIVPNTKHQDTQQRTWWSRSITIPMESPGMNAKLIIEGHDGWAPDIARLEWFELEHFPVLGS